MKTAVDLFCGSGAVTLGLKSAGFQVIGAVDVDPTACATYRQNHPEVYLVEDDIRRISPTGFAEVINDPVHLLSVCAPCQPFSNRNRHRFTKDERTGLVLTALPFVEALKPRLVFFENVPGLGKQPVFDMLAEELINLGYHLAEPQRIDAATMGVPQRRKRMILIGANDGTLLRGANNIVHPTRRTVRDAIYDLPVPPVGAHRAARDALHYARAHAAITIERLRHIPPDGGGRDSLPERLWVPCHKGRRKHSFPDSYGRMKWDDVAPTLTTGCTDLTKGRYAHPEQDRAITLREAARLQSFPDGYTFIGNASQIAIQIGNAVPPRMMAGIARALYTALSEQSQDQTNTRDHV